MKAVQASLQVVGIIPSRVLQKREELLQYSTEHCIRSIGCRYTTVQHCNTYKGYTIVPCQVPKNRG